MKKFFLGVASTLLFLAVLFGIMVKLYTSWYLNDTFNKYFWLWQVKISTDTLKTKDIKFNDNNSIETGNNNLTWYTFIENTWSIIKVVKTKDIKIFNINNLTKAAFIFGNITPKFSDKQIQKKSNLILFFYFVEQPKDQDIFDYYYKHLYKITNKPIIKIKIKKYLTRNNLINYFLNNKNVNNDILNFKKYIREQNNSFNSKVINNHFCFNVYCTKYKEKYSYVKKAIIYNKKLKEYISKYSKKYDIPENVFYSILIIENLRMHISYKINFKTFFLKYKIPKLTIMNKFSYGRYWMKLNIVKQLTGSNLYKNDKDLKALSSIDKDEDKINYIIKHKELQTKFVALFLNYQKQLYKKYWCKKLDNKGWLLATLWNIGGADIKTIKKCNPKNGGADLTFIWLNFGDFADLINSSIDLMYIKNR